MTLPVWLIDVDGVLNIIGWDQDKVTEEWGDTYDFRAMDFRIRVSPRMLKTARSWMDEGLVDPRWLTTWEDLANAHLIERLGWPELPVAGRRAESKLERPRRLSESHEFYREDVGWWKLEFVQAVYETGVPVVWTDDEIRTVRSAMEWVSSVADEGRLLAVSPNAGLTPGHMAAIESFLRQWVDLIQ